MNVSCFSTYFFERSSYCNTAKLVVSMSTFVPHTNEHVTCIHILGYMDSSQYSIMHMNTEYIR